MTSDFTETARVQVDPNVWNAFKAVAHLSGKNVPAAADAAFRAYIERERFLELVRTGIDKGDIDEKIGQNLTSDDLTNIISYITDVQNKISRVGLLTDLLIRELGGRVRLSKD